MDSRPADLDLEREILKALERKLQSAPQALALSHAACSGTSLGSTPQGYDEFVWRVRLMVDKGMVEILGEDSSGDFGLRLLPRGWHRLSMAEEEFRRLDHGSTRSTIHNTVQGGIANITQTVGPNSPIIQQRSEADPVVAQLIDQLLTEIQSNQHRSNTEKKDAEIEVQQLQLELKRPSPRQDRVQSALELVKTFAPLIVTEISKHLPW